MVPKKERLRPRPEILAQNAITLSLIVPTIGRSTLKRTVESALATMGPNDELIVIGDGPRENARKVMHETFDARTRYIETLPSPPKQFGKAQIDLGTKLASKKYLMFCGDDDTFEKEACSIVRQGVVEKGLGEMHIFAMHYGNNILSKSIGHGSVSGQQLVIEKEAANKVSYANCGGKPASSDFNYIQALSKHFQVTFHDEPITRLYTQNSGRMI